jgi:anti-sigma factor RsiW
MKCAEFERVVHDLARQGQLDPAAETIARAHAESCPSCACRLAEAEKLAKMLRAVSAESRRLEAPPQLETLLLDFYRRVTAARRNAPARKRFGWRPGFGWAGAVALAAVALLAFALLSRVPGRRTSSPAVRVSAATPAAVAETARAGASVQSQAQSSQADTDSGFVPVPYASGFGPGESAVIVRVQLPRTSLAELGYPVDETQGNAMVQADLVVGEDGWPQAVRIVR